MRSRLLSFLLRVLTTSWGVARFLEGRTPASVFDVRYMEEDNITTIDYKEGGGGSGWLIIFIINPMPQREAYVNHILNSSKTKETHLFPRATRFLSEHKRYYLTDPGRQGCSTTSPR